jgi:hypothetical protein
MFRAKPGENYSSKQEIIRKTLIYYKKNNFDSR